MAAAAARAAGGPPSSPSPPPYGPAGISARAGGLAALRQFRAGEFAESCYFEFELIEFPRRGPEKAFPGRLWAARDAEGPVLRVEVRDAAGGEHRLLLQNGLRPEAWRLAGDSVRPLGEAEMLRPFFAGIEITPFDLEMPFLYWPGTEFEALERFHGRPTYRLLFHPPPAFAARHPEVAAVRAWLDTQFHALVEAEILDPAGRVSKTTYLVDLKRLGRRTVVKEVDVLDQATRDKTRLDVTAAALGVEFSPALFLPGQLPDSVQPPAGGSLARWGP